MTPADLLKSLTEVQAKSLEIIDPENLEGLVSLYSDFEQQDVKEMITTVFNAIKPDPAMNIPKW